MSDTTLTSFPGINQRLHCIVNGEPIPNITWYDPNGRQMLSNITSYLWGSEILINVKDSTDFGKYKCRVANQLGFSEHNISIVQLGMRMRLYFPHISNK